MGLSGLWRPEAPKPKVQPLGREILSCFGLDLRRSRSTTQDYGDWIGSHGPAVTEAYLNLEKLVIEATTGL